MAYGAARPRNKGAVTAPTVCSICTARFANSSSRNCQRVGSHPNFVKVCLKNQSPWRTALGIYLVGLAVVGFWPTPVDRPVYGTLTTMLAYLHGLGVPEWLDYNFIEVSANVALFVPFGFLAGMAMPLQPWWKVAGIGVLASVCMEMGQLLFIAARFSSLLDFVTNTIGTVMGITAARVVLRGQVATPDTSN